MKIGVKTFDNSEFADYFKDKADFLEVQAIIGKNYDFLEDYPLPIVIHAMHSRWGVNFADKGVGEKNKKAISFAIELANRFNVKKIILHPGRLLNDDCSSEKAVEMIKDLDSRIILENLPFRDRALCLMPEDTNKFCSDSGRGFCFDINHAIESAISKEKDYIKTIKGFISLNPKHYHISGQNILDGKSDTHNSFDNSDIPLKEILDLLPRDAELTLETTTDIEKTENDLNLVRSLVG